MSFVELLLVAVGLSMDAFAVSVCKGLSVKKLGVKHALIAGAYFGGFQFLMPVIGLTLPFFSYGGTALLMQLFEAGIVLAVSRQNDNKLL